jgi:2-hydroxymuconate-semialdehyde hydrolase
MRIARGAPTVGRLMAGSNHAGTPDADGPPRERMLAGVRVRKRTVALAGASTTLLEAGDGPPVVLLHGGIECGGAIWAPIVNRLAERSRLVIPDIPGFGESAPPARLDSDFFDAWLDALLERTCAQPPVLVAHSLAGSHAARYAVGHGDRLRRLVVCAAPGIGPHRMPLRLRAVAIRFAIRPTPRNAERFERFALLDRGRTRGRNPEWFDAFSSYCLERAQLPHVKRAMRELVRTGARRVADAALARVQVPVGLVWGRGDRMTPLATVAPTAAHLGWPLNVIEGAAHVPQLEQPESFLAALPDPIAGPNSRSERPPKEAFG